MENIKAIFIDIDGTIRDSKGSISDNNKLIIKELINKGIEVILTSGRSYEETKEVSKEIGASNIIIACNGAIAGNYSTNELFVNKLIPQEVIKKITNYAVSHKVDIKYNCISSKKDLANVNEIVLLSQNYERMQIIPKLFKDIIPEIEIANSSKSLINKEKIIGKTYIHDLVIPNTSKGNAILEVLEHLHIKEEQTISIGDSNNDISMSLVTGYSVAMKNATEDLKNISSLIIDTNDTDSIYNYLKTLIDKQ